MRTLLTVVTLICALGSPACGRLGPGAVSGYRPARGTPGGGGGSGGYNNSTGDSVHQMYQQQQQQDYQRAQQEIQQSRPRCAPGSPGCF